MVAQSHKPPSRPSAKSRPSYILEFRPLPNVDAIRSIRALLKLSLRRFGLKAVSVSERQPERGGTTLLKEGNDLCPSSSASMNAG
jgi:hypothetical protein